MGLKLGLLAASLLAALGAPRGAAHAQDAPTAASADSVSGRAHLARTRGEAQAPVTIVVFSDYQCPFCRRFEESTLPAIDSAYIRTGKANLLFANYPLFIHPNAWVAAEAALCAGAQGRFWPMHARLFAQQAEWSTASAPDRIFAGYARELGLDPERFRACTLEDQVAPLILADVMALPAQLDTAVRGTPTVVLLRRPRRGEEVAGVRRVLEDPLSVEGFRKTMEELLAGSRE